RLRRLLSRRHADRRDRTHDHEFAPGQSPQHARRRGPARDPVGVFVDAVPLHRHRLVWLGSALERGAEAFGNAELAEMAREWPFFANVLDEVEMLLAKCDLGIAEAFS